MPNPGSYAELARLAWAPRKTDPRSEIVVMGVIARSCYAFVAREDQAFRSRWENGGLLARPECVDSYSAIKDVVDGSVHLPAHTVGDCQVGFDFPLVLGIGVIGLCPRVNKSAAGLFVEVRRSKHEIGCRSPVVYWKPTGAEKSK